jgi:hypothetical protein
MSARLLRSLARSTALAIFAALAFSAEAGVVRPAPSFTFGGTGGKNSLGSLRGQPVVLIIARTAQARALRTQLGNLRAAYHDSASRGAVFVAAILDGDTVPSDIPFVHANNPASVAAAYGMQGDFLIAVIGRDGNLDLVTDKPIPGMRVFEVIKNNFDVQDKARRELPGGASGR